MSTSHPARVAGSNVELSVALPIDSGLWLESTEPSSNLVGDVADIARTASPNAMVDVIVAYDSVAAAQGARAQSAESDQAGSDYSVLPFRAMSVPASALETLSRSEGVRYVTRDSEVFGASQPARQTARVPGSGSAASSPNVAYPGTAVTVAVVDTGVWNHPDFSALVAARDFVNGAGGVNMATYDGFGHGTHVAGMVAGTGAMSWSGKYKGVATGARIVSLRVLDADGRGQLSDVLAALDWIIAVGKNQYGIRVANLSLGKGVEGAQTLDPLVQAVEAVWDAGVVVVVSAGNHGDSGHFTIASPGNSRKVITVGSLTDNGSGTTFSDDYVSTFSSRGPTLFDHVLKPDLVAPGNRIVSPYAEASTIGHLVTPDRIFCGYTGTTVCSYRYLRLSGTSMAAGVVSGAVARMLQKDPTLTPDTVKARLMKSARKVAGDPTETGAGVLDVDAAMNATGVMNTRALSPLMQLSPDGALAYVQDTEALWGNSQWSASYLWADGFLWTNAAPMGASGYLWSNSYLWSNAYLWANSYLWTNGFLWSDAVKPASLEAEDPGEEVEP